jgi:hypothetical protein
MSTPNNQAPSRRALLRTGGAVVLGTTVLVGCGGGDDDDRADRRTAVSLLRTASALDELAVETYDAVLATGLVANPGADGTARLFRDHHREHATRLQAATVDAGGERYRDPHPGLKRMLVDPAITALTDEAGAITLLLALENVLAQSCVAATARLPRGGVRKDLAAIGGIEARHAAGLAGILSQPTVPAPFLPTVGALTEADWV